MNKRYFLISLLTATGLSAADTLPESLVVKEVVEVAQEVTAGEVAAVQSASQAVVAAAAVVLKDTMAECLQDAFAALKAAIASGDAVAIEAARTQCLKLGLSVEAIESFINSNVEVAPKVEETQPQEDKKAEAVTPVTEVVVAPASEAPVVVAPVGESVQEADAKEKPELQQVEVQVSASVVVAVDTSNATISEEKPEADVAVVPVVAAVASATEEEAAPEETESKDQKPEASVVDQKVEVVTAPVATEEVSK